MDTSLHYLTMANQMLIQKRLLERVKASGLTLGQPKVLDYLKDHDGASQKEIAAGCFIEAGSLTSILNRMEEKGLIERRMLNGNRRTFHIFMTESGKKSQKLVEEAFVERVKASGLTLGQPKVLDYLKDHDGASQKEIAAGCFIEAGSLTSILNRMEEKGLIERRMLNGNRRTFHIFMTESGKKSQKLVEEAFVEIEEAAWKDISPEEAEAFMKIYHKIYSNLSETGCEETGKEGRNK